MVTKEIKTKIALRYLDYTTWSAEAFQTEKPLKGEVWFCEVPTGNANATTAPTMLFKVGDGINTFGALKWASALAADVYTWAKQANLPVERADEKNEDGTDKVAGNVISSIYWENDKIKYTTASVATSEGMAAITKDIADNRDAWAQNDNTTYQFSIPAEGDDKGKLLVEKKEIDETEWTKVDAYDFVTPDELDGILADYYTKENLEGKIHTEDEIKAMEIAHATAAGKVDEALTVTVGGEDIVFNGSEAKTVDIDAAIEAAKVDYTVTCADTDHEATEGAPAFKRHTLTQNGKQVCVIDVPRDLVIKSGSVDKEKNELVLVLVNDEEIRVDVSHLIEYVTGGTATDGIITVNVDDNFVATATINNGTITEEKLHTDVTTKLNKVWDAEGAAATAKEEAIAAAAKDAGDKAAVVLGEAQKYADEKVAALAGEGNTTTVAALAGRVNTLETAGYLTEVVAKDYDEEGNEKVSGLKVQNKNEIAIDDSVVFILDCNW